MISAEHTAAASPRRRRQPLTLLTASLASLLLATACAGGEKDASASSASSSAASGSAEAESASDASASPSATQNTEPAEVGDGQGEPDALKGVTLEQQGDAAPKVTVDGEITTDQQTTRVLDTGDGEPIDDGALMRLAAAVVDPATGEVQIQNFTDAPELVPLGEQLKEGNPEMYDLFSRMNVGGEVAVYIPSQEVPVPAATSSDAPSPSPTTATQPAQLLVYRIVGLLTPHAQGAEVTERDDRLPEVTVDGNTQKPAIAKPEGEAPGELVVAPLIAGEGRTVEKTDTVTVQYTGVTWSDGSTFDSSWDRGEPATFPLTGVIPGWTEGLAGQRVGSRVLLSVPSEKAYGEQGSAPNIGANEDLLFVVDILDAQAPPEPVSESAQPSDGDSASPSAGN